MRSKKRGKSKCFILGVEVVSCPFSVFSCEPLKGRMSIGETKG